MTLLFLFFACTPLAGDWVGQVDCGGYAMDVEVTLEWKDSEYVGEGLLDCTNGYGAACEQSFDLEVDVEGARDLDVDVDECYYHVNGQTSQASCDNPDDVEWDGAVGIVGDWAGCEVELERD